MSDVTVREGFAWYGRWFCLDCEAILRKPPYRKGDARYHSWRCQRPLVRVDVHISEAP